MQEQVLIKKIKEMDSMELLEEILNSPDYITDPYFKEICKTIYFRFEELKNGK